MMIPLKDIKTQEFTEFVVEKTMDHVESLRGDRPEFRLWREEGIFHAKFDYGREGTGTLIDAVYGAIAGALEPLNEGQR
jgi:hypothetical protein